MTYWGLTIRTVVVHTVTYFIVGSLAFTIFDYGARFAEAGLSTFMRPTSDPLVMAGPLFQPIRGALFGLVFYLLRNEFFGKPNGWVTMWIVLVMVGIFSTFGPSPGSVEGFIFTTVPISSQLFGLIEILAQSLLLSFVLFYWVEHPEKRWLTWTLGVAFILVLVLPALGLLVGQGDIS
ncbi:MAG: hypothetical protein V3U35_02000 [Candidatus Neomarinimicrobiota bacterium]